ncbi:MAG: T9SS type A sorting domain-containing protein [Bacteroidota bacterium]
MKLVTCTHYLFAILLAVPALLFSQPVLTDANNPVPLTAYSQQDAVLTAVGPGSDAANSSWDFSMLMPDGEPFSFQVDIAANSAFADSFPEATFFSDLGEDSAAFFLNASSTGIEILGSIVAFQDEESMTVDTFTLKYTDPQTFLSYPFGPDASVEDTYQFGFDLFGLGTSTTTGSQTQEGSGYGTLSTPEGTFENVLRIKTTSVETDSLVALGGFFTTVSTTFSTQYTWHQAGEFNILMTWTKDSIADPDFGSSVDTTISYGFGGVSTSISEQLEKDLSLQIYPSPMVDYLQIGVSLETSTALELSLYDLSGRMVASLPSTTYSQGGQEIQLETSQLVPGTYFLKIQTGEKALFRKVQKR